MRKFIIATHGKFAKGFKQSLELIIGKRDDIYTVNAYVDDIGIDQASADIMKQIEEDDELIIFTDVMYGSVNQYFVKFITRPHTHLITGFNLSIVLEMVLFSPNENIAENMDMFIQKGKEQLLYMNTVNMCFEEED